MDRDLLRSAIAVDFLLVTIFYRGGSLLSCIFDHVAINMLGFMLLSGWRLGFCRYMICFVAVNLFLLLMMSWNWIRYEIKRQHYGFNSVMKFHLYGTSASGIEVSEYATTDENGVATFKNVLIAGAAGYTMEEVDTAVRYVIPDGNMEYKSLLAMVTEINATQVDTQDKLTDQVYHYDVTDKVFEKASRYEDRRIEKEESKTFAGTKKTPRREDVSL